MTRTHLIVSCSLRTGSHSSVLAKELAADFRARDVEVVELDLRDADLPFCDGDGYGALPEVRRVNEVLAQADSVTLAVPIYNFDVGGAARNFVALTSARSWEGKIVGFLCAAGGRNSYMSVMGLANSLMLDFRCLVVPRFVYAARADFDDGEIAAPAVRERLGELCSETLRLVDGLNGH